MRRVQTRPVRLLVEKDGKLITVDIPYHDGQRYPSLQRVDGTQDLLDEITKPLSPNTVLPAPAKGRGEQP